MYQATEHKMSIYTPCLHRTNMVKTWLDGPYCFLFFKMYRCRSERWITKGDRTKRLNKAMSRKNKNAHFQWMRHLPRHPPHGTAGPNKGGNICLIDVRLKERVLFPETNNQAA